MYGSVLKVLKVFVLVLFVINSIYAKSEQQVRLPLDELKALADTYQKIKQAYVDNVDDKKLIEGAINGMLNTLDPYSSYLNKDELLDLQASSEGVYDGLGVEVIVENNRVKIVGTMLDSPADRAGLRADDIITEINHIKVASVGAAKAIDSMRGKAGEHIHLKIYRLNNEFDLNLTRETLEVKSVVIEETQPGFWHAKVRSFQVDTGYELARQIRLKALTSTFKGLVLDLRDNPGGVLRAAVDVVDLMLADGLIVSTVGRTDESKQKYFANPGDVMENMSVVVLINERSASASEIVAGALQDHKRALILGSTSFGKGLVQSILSVQPEAAIKLTTSRYFTPKGRSIHGVGIQPDIALKANAKDAVEDEYLKQAIHLLVEQSQ